MQTAVTPCKGSEVGATILLVGGTAVLVGTFVGVLVGVNARVLVSVSASKGSGVSVGVFVVVGALVSDAVMVCNALVGVGVPPESPSLADCPTSTSAQIAKSRKISTETM